MFWVSFIVGWLEGLVVSGFFCCYSRNNSGNRGGRGNDEDDGDYATLRQLPLPPSSSTNTDTGDDTASEEGKVSDIREGLGFYSIFHEIISLRHEVDERKLVRS